MKKPKHKGIGLIGYGALGRQIKSFVFDNNKGNLYLFDDLVFEEKVKNSFRFEEYIDPRFSDLEFYICLGYKNLKKKENVLNALLQLGRKIPTFIHSSCFVNSSATIGKGTIIYPMCNIDAGVKLGNGVLLNNSVTVSHESVVNDATFVAPGVVLCGRVNVGKRSFIGAGSVIKNDVKVGADSKIGMLSSVIKNVQKGASVVGSPARATRTSLKL